MPSMFGKDSKKKELIKNLTNVYDQIEKQHGISRGDFPELKKLQVGLKLLFFNASIIHDIFSQDNLQNQDFSKFHSLRPALLEAVDKMLAQDIAPLMSLITKEEATNPVEPVVKG
jgi:EH domain-containing protein 1